MESQQPVSDSQGPGPYSTEFVTVVRRVLEDLGGRLEGFQGGYLIAGFEGKRHGLGLENLYRVWGSTDFNRGEALVRLHLSKARDALLDSEKSRETERNFEVVRERIMPRVGPAFNDPAFQNRVVAHRLTADGLFLNFVIDYPQTVTYVEIRFLDDWGTNFGELRTIALENLRKKNTGKKLRPPADGEAIHVCDSRDTYDASRILLLEEIFEEAPRTGLMCAVPARDLLMAWPLSKEKLGDLHKLYEAAKRSHSQMAYPILPNLYWVRDGRIVHIPTKMEADKLVVLPPDEFVEALQEDEGDSG
jgi:hypothetical protein